MPRENKTAVYEIRVEGTVDASWSDWFEGLAMRSERVERGLTVTTLTGAIADQSALRAVLSKIWDLNLTVVSMIRIETSSPRERSVDEDDYIEEDVR